MTESDANSQPNGRWLTAQQVAERFQVTPWTIKNLHRVGKLRGVIVSRKLRFPPQSIEAFERELLNA